MATQSDEGDAGQTPPLEPQEVSDGTAADPGESSEEAVETAEVSAEEVQLQRARDLFSEGVALSGEGQWAEAISKYEEALRIHPAAAIRLNLASAHVELGHYRPAQQQLDIIASDPETDDRFVALAEILSGRLREEAGWLDVESTALDSGRATLRLDGQAVAPLWIGRPFPVAPGRHRVAAIRSGRELSAADVRTHAGETTTVVLALDLSGESDRPPIGDSDAPQLHERWEFWAAVGAGVVVIGSAIAIGAAASSGGGMEPPIEGNFQPGVITWP